jgi:hypothetical protein
VSGVKAPEAEIRRARRSYPPSSIDGHACVIHLFSEIRCFQSARRDPECDTSRLGFLVLAARAAD